MSRSRRAAVLVLKLTVAALLTVVLVELGTRLIIPEKRFELIPNTFDPVCGIRQQADTKGFVHCPEYTIRIVTNGGGLRDDHDHAYERTPGITRILVLGDSFACGMGVSRAETFAARLDSLLGPRVEVLNGGVCATGTAEQLAWYELEGHRYRPDIVLLAHVVNDWTDNAKSGLFSLAADSALVQHPAREGRTLRWLRRLKRLPGYGTWFAQSHALNRFRQWFAGHHHGQLVAEAAGGQVDAEVWRHERVLSDALLRRLRERCRAHCTALVVMPVPALPESGEAERRQAELAAFLTREGFAWFDLRPRIADGMAAGALLYYPVDGHWTAAGHALAAEWLAEMFRNLVGECVQDRGKDRPQSPGRVKGQTP